MILLAAAILIMIYMSLVWAWYRVTNNPSVVDIAWSFGLTLIGLLVQVIQKLVATHPEVFSSALNNPFPAIALYERGVNFHHFQDNFAKMLANCWSLIVRHEHSTSNIGLIRARY